MSAQIIVHPSAARRMPLREFLAWCQYLGRYAQSTRRGHLQLVYGRKP